MKTKALILVATVAVVTLSFTFVNKEQKKATNGTSAVNADQSAPAGGFAAEEISK